MHRRVIITGAVLAGLGLARPLAAPVAADGSGFGFTEGPSVGAGANDVQVNDPQPVATRLKGGSAAPRCEYAQLDAEESETAERLARKGWLSPRAEEPGAWFQKICFDDNGMSSGSTVWVRDRVDPEALARQALERVPLPPPRVRMNPSAGAGAVTNVETWLWIDPGQWQPVSASASAGGVTVTTTATPERVVFDMGSGDKVTCAGPGTPYDPTRRAAEQTTSCAYTYRRSSAHQPDGRYVVSATVFYRVRWSASGIAAGGALAPISQTESVPLRVAEIQALNQ